MLFHQHFHKAAALRQIHDARNWVEGIGFAQSASADGLKLGSIERWQRFCEAETAAQRVLDELILARVRVMTAPERTAFLAHVRDIVDSVEDNVTSVPVESVEPDDAEDTEEAE